MTWIPVTERLPERDPDLSGASVRVLFYEDTWYDGPMAMTGRHCSGDEWSDDDGAYHRASYWMPLPEPPK